MTSLFQLVLLTFYLANLALAILGLYITQTPPEIRTYEGASTEINCSWDTEKAESIKVTWCKRKLPSENSSENNGVYILSYYFFQNGTLKDIRDLNPNHEPRSDNRMDFNDTTKDKTALKIKSVNTNDTGIYYCEVTVEIPPPYKKGQGNGTIVAVEKREKDKGYAVQKNYIFIVLVILPVLILSIYCYYKKKQSIRNKAPEDNPDEQDTFQSTKINELYGEINNSGEGNSSSSDSTKWVVSTFYDSIDYFTMKEHENGDNRNRSSCDTPGL